MVEFAIPVEIPALVLADLVGHADVATVVVRNGVVLYAPGESNLGRDTRLASRAQRRARRGLYRCCAIPGWNVTYDRCKLHHVIWWRNGGTDLDNLLPVCSVHHAKIHHDGWTIDLGPDGELTLTLPDGTSHTTTRRLTHGSGGVLQPAVVRWLPWECSVAEVGLGSQTRKGRREHSVP